MEYLNKHTKDITTLCKRHHVKTLHAFGSVLTNRFNTNSDVDLIVDIDEPNPLTYADNYFDLKFALEDLLKRPIDLLENKAIRNPYLRQSIDDTKQLIYAK